MSTVETMAALPVAIALIAATVFGLALASLRLSLVKTAEDYATCHLGAATAVECAARARSQARDLLSLGGFSNAHVIAWYHPPAAVVFVRASWGALPIHWELRAQSPLPSAPFR